MRIGVIAEDDSDVAVIREITLTLLSPYCIGFRSFVGDGCGKLRRKCGAWASVLIQQGCPWIIVVHDLDDYNEAELRELLAGTLANSNPTVSVVLLPKREIEAWLLYDPAAIAGVFNKTIRPTLPGDPESVLDPKKYLRDLIKKIYAKQYLNTVHNPLIAKRINVNLLRRATSFAPHPVFAAAVRQVLDRSRSQGRRQTTP
jgi:hypothetical protein